jgi:hypothetical protein
MNNLATQGCLLLVAALIGRPAMPLSLGLDVLRHLRLCFATKEHVL